MIKNYVYISRSKLAAYVPQILEDKFFRKDGQKVVAELGFDLKAISGKLRLEQTPLENCIGLLKLTEQYIEKNHMPGNLDSGKDWIAGELGMKYIRIGNNKNIFALIGKVNSAKLLLVGSQVHTLIGGNPQPINTQFSHFQVIEETLMEDWVEASESMNDQEFKLHLSLSSDTSNINSDIVGDFEMTNNINELLRQANRQTVRVTFLARRLFWARQSDGDEDMCGMFTPLYVIQE